MRNGTLVVMLFAVVSGNAQIAGTFSTVGNMSAARAFHTATLLNDGRVLIAGGKSASNSIVASAEIYDPSTSTFASTGSMTTSRAFHTATRLPDGRVLIAGGTQRNIAELYDPSTGNFTAMYYMGHSYNCIALLNNGKLLMGPVSGDGSAELWDPVTNVFTSTGGFSDSAIKHINLWVFLATPTLLIDGRVLIPALPLALIYDAAAGAFALTAFNYPAPVFSSVTSTLLTDGTVLFAGGLDTSAYAYADAAIYDPVAGTFRATGNMTKARQSHTATLLPDGMVLVTGGAWDDATNASHQSAELYDPRAGAFSLIGNMTAARSYHTATLLTDGRVLITGGWNSREPEIYLNSAEIYDPPHRAPAAALLSQSGDGKGPGAIQHADTYQLVSADNPALAGEALVIYCTGLIDGSLIPPQVFIGGRGAEILYFGKAPGYDGLNQINVRVPNGVAPGPTVPVRLTYMMRPSNEVTIAVEWE